MKKIIDLIEKDKIKQALKLCDSLINNNSTTAEAFNLKGLIYARQGNFQQAITELQKSIQLDPYNALYHNNISNAYKKLGEITNAKCHLYEALRLAPNYAEAYNNLASLYYTQGRIEQAIPIFKKAIRLNPFNWEAHYNLANSLIKQNAILEAIDNYLIAIKLQPNHSYAKQNLAMAYVMQKDFTNALPFLEEAAANNSYNADLQAQLAEAYLETGNHEKALLQYQLALKLDDKRYEWHHNIAVLYLNIQQQNQALHHFQQALQLNPNNNTACHMVQALTGNNKFNVDTSQYVVDLFDQYAAFYDQHVKNKLNYEVPSLLRQTIGNLSNIDNYKSILDLGCGTGLCGIYFRDMARFLVGVDISQKMLAQAKLLGAYDALCNCNILENIPGYAQQSFDLILAADVLVYIGNLNNIINLCSSALKPSGVLAFTIESLESIDSNKIYSNKSENYQLLTTGRYAHNINYIEKMAAEYGFTILINKQITLRTYNNNPTTGNLFVLEKNKNNLII